MAGVAVKVDDAEFVAWLNQVTERLSNLEPLLRIMGATVQASIQRNFEEGGRPAKWASHSKTTIKRRGAGAKILTALGFAGGLLGSINYQVDQGSVSVGTNKICAAVQQFGAKQGQFGSMLVRVRGHERTRRGKTVWVGDYVRETFFPWGDIPARPFIAIQAEDKTEMVAEVREYLGKGSQ